jgi:hypothetical protein
MIIAEWILRGLLTVRYAIFPKKEKTVPDES